MTIPVIINGKVQRRVLMTMTERVMAASPTDEDYIEANMRRLQNEVIKDLVPYFQDYFLSHDTLDALGIKARLVKHAKAVFGERVRDVLLVNLFKQSAGRPKE